MTQNLAGDVFGYKILFFVGFSSRCNGNACHASLNKLDIEGSLLSKMRI